MGSAGQPAPASIPAEYRAHLGRVTIGRTIPQLKAFAENGGTILTIGSSTVLGRHFELPVYDALVERGAGGMERPMPREKYYIPGSILEARVDHTQPLAYGMGRRAMVFHDHSPVFRLTPESSLAGVKPIVWYDSATPLRSGWAWGQSHLENTVSIVQAPVGKGQLVMYGNEVLWRGQPHGTFKLFFNGLFVGSAAEVR